MTGSDRKRLLSQLGLAKDRLMSHVCHSAIKLLYVSLITAIKKLTIHI